MSFAFGSNLLELAGAIITLFGLGRAIWGVRDDIARREQVRSGHASGTFTFAVTAVGATPWLSLNELSVDEKLAELERRSNLLHKGQLDQTHQLVSLGTGTRELASSVESLRKDAAGVDAKISRALEVFDARSNRRLAHDLLIAGAGAVVSIVGIALGFWA